MVNNENIKFLNSKFNNFIYVDDIYGIIDNFLKKKERQFFYELNISCPNTKNGKTISESLTSLEAL